MNTANVRLEHVGVGCNRVVHALHWGDAGMLACAAHHAVVVYEPEEARVLGMLLGHTDIVTCVRWLPTAASCGPPASTAGNGAPASAATIAAIASGSGDCSVRIWLWTPHTPDQPWRLAAVLAGHSAPVTSLTVHARADDRLLLVSTAGDGEVLVWECSSSSSSSSSSSVDPEVRLGQASWRLSQRIPLGHQLQNCAALAHLPAHPDWLLLALGGVDAAVRLYCCPPGGRFEAVCKLTGHQDWVRGLDFAQPQDGKLLLASASQDKNVRVWAITLQQDHDQQQQQQQADANSSIGGSGSGSLDLSCLAQSLTRYAPKPLIRAGQHAYAATLEALLIGHEDWVHSVAWLPLAGQSSNSSSGGGDGGRKAGAPLQPACLLSASMDRTMMIWRADPATGLWMSDESVGDAGANHLGYYTGVFAPDGSGIAAHGFTGALHIWRRQPGGGWLPQHALGGHFGPVVDACWAADGACLLTVSTDQTARITTRLASGHWCEIARPQVHGHDFSSVAALPCGTGRQQSGNGGAAGGAADEAAAAGPGAESERYMFVSGSEEKVIRVFEAPRAFMDTLAMARGRAVAGQPGSITPGGISSRTAALGALLPALGLSNKAIYQGHEAHGNAAAAHDAAQNGAAGGGARGLVATGAEAYCDGPDLAPHAAPCAVEGPPLEEHLAQNTLWPEIHKLYGHGNDLYCLAADPLGVYLASACRAQSADAAAIWLWDTAKWTGVLQLHAHALTVTQLAFSPDGRFLASASRDRTVALFERQLLAASGTAGAAAGEGVKMGAAAGFRLVGRIRAHARIVWGLHWSPDSQLLATASRDGKVKVWSIDRKQASKATDGESAVPGLLPTVPLMTIECGDSVRSVQFVPDCQPGTRYHLAAGLESGAVQLLQLATQKTSGPAAEQQQQQQEGQLQEWLAVCSQQLLWQTSELQQHAAAVRRLCWRRDKTGQSHQQIAADAQCARYHLASCSEDHSLRVFSVAL